MRADAIAVPQNGFDMPIEREDIGLDADFLVKFARDRFGKGFAELDDPSGKGEASDHRLPRPAPNEDLAIPKHRDRNREDRTLGVEPVINGRTCGVARDHG